jgi:hypothetical protein
MNSSNSNSGGMVPLYPAQAITLHHSEPSVTTVPAMVTKVLSDQYNSVKAQMVMSERSYKLGDSLNKEMHLVQLNYRLGVVRTMADAGYWEPEMAELAKKNIINTAKNL